MRRVGAAALVALTACADGPFVEPSILEPTASIVGDHVEGSFVLSLYLAPEANGASEVHLKQLSWVIDVSPEGGFPITIEPGELARAALAYTTHAQPCPMRFDGTIYDSLKGGETPVVGPSVPCG